MGDTYRGRMGGLSITHWLIVLLAVVLLFGARRLPDTARGLARSLRIFKSEMGGTDDAEPQDRKGEDRERAAAEPQSRWPLEPARSQGYHETPPRDAAQSPVSDSERHHQEQRTAGP